MNSAVFGWQGFHFEHPDDWAPVSLTGRRETGYARLSGPGKVSCHVRWVRAHGNVRLETKLDDYLKTLAADAKRKKLSFQSSVETDGDRLHYRWTAHMQARGTIVVHEPSKRVFFLEVTGERKDQLLPLVRSIRDSFTLTDPKDPVLWSMLGLQAKLPSIYQLERAKLVTGSATLTLRHRMTSIQLARQGLVNEAMAGANLIEFMRSRFPKRAKISERGANEAELIFPSRVPYVLPSAGTYCRLNPELNQLHSLSWSTASPKWRPEWDWLL